METVLGMWALFGAGAWLFVAFILDQEGIQIDDKKGWCLSALFGPFAWLMMTLVLVVMVLVWLDKRTSLFTKICNGIGKVFKAVINWAKEPEREREEYSSPFDEAYEEMVERENPEYNTESIINNNIRDNL